MSTHANRLSAAAAALAIAFPTLLQAQLAVGTWVRKSTADMPGDMTMKVEPCCNGGRRLTYLVEMGQEKATLTVESRLDGSEAPVLLNGKPTGESMAIKRIDDHHTVTVLGMNGKQFGTSKAALSPDGKTLTIVDKFTAYVAGHKVGKFTETWTRQ